MIFLIYSNFKCCFLLLPCINVIQKGTCRQKQTKLTYQQFVKGNVCFEILKNKCKQHINFLLKKFIVHMLACITVLHVSKIYLLFYVFKVCAIVLSTQCTQVKYAMEPWKTYGLKVSYFCHLICRLRVMCNNCYIYGQNNVASRTVCDGFRYFNFNISLYCVVEVFFT